MLSIESTSTPFLMSNRRTLYRRDSSGARSEVTMIQMAEPHPPVGIIQPARAVRLLNHWRVGLSKKCEPVAWTARTTSSAGTEWQTGAVVVVVVVMVVSCGVG
jgi:hypothetical protein